MQQAEIATTLANASEERDAGGRVSGACAGGAVPGLQWDGASAVAKCSVGFAQPVF